jgi:hypothetical protein
LDYTLLIGPFEVCGIYQFVNTASFATSDQDGEGDDTGTATYTVTIDVPCPTGCTLTQGYWKTHSEHGPAPYDDTWAMLENGADTPFFESGQTYYEVLWTPPQGGNAYYILAHQYIAAELNMLAGTAVPAEVQTAFDAATLLFETYTPDEVGELKGKAGKDLRDQFIGLAGTLGSYNEGDIGPGHCDEDGTTAASEPVLEASTLPIAITALVIALMAAGARRGRYAREHLLLG